MCELLLDGALTARSSQVSEHDHGVARSSLEVKLCNLPSCTVVLQCVSGTAGIPDMDVQRSVQKASEAPAILVPPLVGHPDGAHPRLGQVRELLEKIVVDGTSADDPHHAAHPETEVARNI